jgi:hypothetical protein
VIALVGERLTLHQARFAPRIRLTALQTRISGAADGGRQPAGGGVRAPADGCRGPWWRSSSSASPAGRQRAAGGAPPAATTAAVPASPAPGAAPLAPVVEALGNDVMEAFLRYRQQDASISSACPRLPLGRRSRIATGAAARWAAERFAAPGSPPTPRGATCSWPRRSAAPSWRRPSSAGPPVSPPRCASRRARPSLHTIRTDLLDPEVQFARAWSIARPASCANDAAVRVRRRLRPTEQFYRQAGVTRYQLSPATAARAVGELEEALRADPQCGLASYYAGVLLGELGRIDEAEVHLRAASRRMAPDRRPIDALKTLVGKRKR